MEQSPAAVTNTEQWFLTTQGATIEGVEPEGNEVLSWAFTVLLRDVVYGLPDGVNAQEWTQWVELINSLWEDILEQMGGEDAGELPVIIYRFLELYSEFVISGVIFDLRDILRYKVDDDQPLMFGDLKQEAGEDGVVRGDGAKCVEFKRLIAQWNRKRARCKLPRLKYDTVRYKGRWTKKRSKDLQLDPSMSIYDFEGPDCPAKVCGMWTYPEVHDRLGEIEEDGKIIYVIDDDSDDYDDDGDELQVISYSKQAQHDEKARYDDEAQHDDEVRHDGEVVDDETAQDDEEMAEPEDERARGYELRANQHAKRSAKPAKTIAKRTTTQAQKVHCAGKIEYWRGMIELIESYWTCAIVSVWIIWIGKWQFALIPCTSCIKDGRPCIIFLDLTPTCVGCIKGKHSCSFVPNIGEEKIHVNSPYSTVIGKYFHLKQITLAMKGEPLFLAPQRITDVNFSPGIPLGTKVSNYPKGSVGPAQDAARQKLADVAGTEWRESWYGVPYEAAKIAYAEIDEGNRDERLWRMTDIPTEEDLELIAAFYNHWDDVVANDDWTAEDMMSIFPSEPRLNIIPTEGRSTTRDGSDGEGSSDGEDTEEEMEDGPGPESEDEEPAASGAAPVLSDKKGKGRAGSEVPQIGGAPEVRNDMEVDDDELSSRAQYIREEIGSARKGELFEVPTRTEAPPIDVDEDSMQIDMVHTFHDGGAEEPSPPRTPTRSHVAQVAAFLSPIQRELNRPGTSLTQRTAGILNAELSNRFNSLSERLDLLAADSRTLDPASPVRHTIQDTQDWFDEVRSTLPKTMEEVQQLRSDHNRLESELQLTRDRLRAQEEDTERRVREGLERQRKDFEEQLGSIVEEKVAYALRDLHPTLGAQSAVTSFAQEQDHRQHMVVDPVEGGIPSLDAGNNQTAEESSAIASDIGLYTAQFGLSAVGEFGTSISTSSTLHGATEPSISFTFGSGIAAGEPSASTINSNLPFANFSLGPTFQTTPSAALSSLPNIPNSDGREIEEIPQGDDVSRETGET